MSKTVRIRINNGQALSALAKNTNSYLFATNGKKYLPIVMERTAVNDESRAFIKSVQMSLRPQQQYIEDFKSMLGNSGEMFCERSHEGESTISLNHFADSEFSIASAHPLVKQIAKSFGIVDDTINFTYSAVIKNVEDTDNIYIFAASYTQTGQFYSAEEQPTYMYIPWKCTHPSTTYVLNGELLLSTMSDDSEGVVVGEQTASYTTGWLKYQNYQGSTKQDQSNIWKSNLVKLCGPWESIACSSQWTEDPNTTNFTYSLKSLYINQSANLIPQRTRMVQIPASDLNDENNTVDLYFDGTYLTQITKKASEVNDLVSKNNDSKNISYSGLVIYKPQNSYIYHNPNTYIFSYTFFNEPSTPKWKIGPTVETGSAEFTNWKKANQKVKKKWKENDVTYSMMQQVNTMHVDTKDYGYISYEFTYISPNCIGNYVHADIATYIGRSGVEQVDVDFDNSTTGVVLSNELISNMSNSGTFVVEDKKHEFAPYKKINFSDDGFETVTELYCDSNNKCEIYSNSRIFYIDIQQHQNYENFVPKITTSSDLQYYQVLQQNSQITGWRYAFVCNSDIEHSEIYIGLPKSSIDSIKDNSLNVDVTRLYDVVLKVTYRNEKNSKTPNNTPGINQAINGTITNSELLQATECVDNTLKTTNSATSNTQYYWTDDMFNRTGHIYTYAVPIETSSGTEYYGVRARIRNNDIRNDKDLGIPENVTLSGVPGIGSYVLGYNLPCNIVSLTQTKETDYIYSFKNGEQYLKVSDKYKGKELFPTVLSSQSHLLNGDKTKPEYYLSYTKLISGRTDIDAENIYELYDTNGHLLDKYKDYLISVSYVLTLRSDGVEVIKNSSNFELSGSNTYEGVYDPINNSQNLSDYEKIYTKETTYTQLKLDNYDYIKSKTLVGNEYFYKYKNKSYIPYTLSELKNLSKSDVVYEKYTEYVEITNTTKNKEQLGTCTYAQRFVHTQVDKNAVPTRTRYYATVSGKNKYIPQGVGILTDDSTQYYAYTYVLLSDAEMLRYKNVIKLNENTNVYIKEDYREITSEADFNALKAKGAKIYVNSKSATSRTIAIQPTVILDEIDLSGKTIYLDENNKAIDISQLKNRVSKQTEIASNGLTTNEQIVSRKELVKKHAITGKTTFAADNVVTKINLFDFQNKYVEKDVPEWTTTQKLYANEPGYTKVPNNLICVGSTQQYYAWRLDKITPNQVRSLNNQTSLQTYVFVDASEFLGSEVFNENYGVYKQPVTNKEFKIAKVNQYGFIEYNGVKYYNRTTPVVQTQDIYLNPNKVYYRKTNATQYSSTLSEFPLSATSYNVETSKIMFDPAYQVLNNADNIVFDWSSVKYYTNNKLVHELSETGVDSAKKFPHPIPDCEYIKRDLLYSTYTINEGILKSNGGAYYTNIAVFDKNNGSVSKTLYLNQHIIDIDKYTYISSETHVTKVTSDTVIRNVQPDGYKNYGFTYSAAGNIHWLDELSQSPAYYFNLPTYTLYTKVQDIGRHDYTCSSTPGAYHYWNNATYTINTFLVDDNLFGIICPYYNISLTPTGSTSNMFDLEVVKLYKFNKQNPGQIIQDEFITAGVLSKTIPFALTNDVTYETTGTYQWHEPLMGYALYTNDGLTYSFTENEIEKVQGYWTTNYERNVIPFHVASYTFYPNTNEITNVSATYSFVPNSYVLSSKVEYPEISYKTITVETGEYIYYSYVDNGLEQKYTNEKIQVNDDFTYTGLIEKVIFAESVGKFVKVNKPIKLIQHKCITKNSQVTNIVEQEKREETNWFAYKTSLALTNEKIPVLYNTELMPATTKEIQYWDEETSSYELKTVIASYAYYAYQYMYDTIPLKIASYLYQASYLTIDNWEVVGTYIEKASKSLSAYARALSDGFDKWSSKYSATENSKIASINKAYDLIASYTKNGFVELNTSVNNMSSVVSNALNNSAIRIAYQEKENNTNLVGTITKYSTVLNSTINDFNSYVTYGIERQTSVLDYGLNTVASYIKNIVIGDSIDMTKSTDIVTYNDVIISYSSISDPALDSLGELIARAFITADSTTYQYVDTYGYTHNIINYSYTGLSDVLKRIQIVPGIPTKQEFVMDLAPKMFANCDFDTEIVDDVEYDSNGNITKKKTHKNNPTDMAKKIIYRAGVLWDELAKAGYCDDNLVERKQEKLLAIKTASQAAVTAVTPEEKSIAVNKLSQALKTKVKK